MDAITMYDTLGPIKTNGQWSVQLTATSSKEEADRFRKLYEQQQSTAKTSNTAKTSETDTPSEDAPKADASAEETPKDGEALEVQEDPKLREQMMLAAAAMLQNPVVTQIPEPVAVTEQTPEVQVPTAEITAQPEELPEVQEATVQTEILPETPQARQETQTFTQTVETVEAPEQTAETPEVQAVETADSGADVQEGEDQENLEAGNETLVFQDVREVPVKVGEAPAAEKSTEAQPLETQIGEKLTEALKNGETRVEIQLTPENLGKVTIEVTLNQEGALHITLHAENPATRSLLTRDMSGLQMMLARDTQQDVRVEVSQQQENHNIYDQQQNRQQQNSQQHQRHQERRESAEDFLHQLRLGLIPVEGE